MKLNYTLDPKTARQLATAVAKQSDGISVKIGETNGKPVLHLINRNLPGKIASRNLVSEADWAEHQWNRQAQRSRKDRRSIDGLDEAIANKEAQ